MKKAIIILASIATFIVLIMKGGCLRQAQDPNTISIWHWMTDRQEAFEELARQYEVQNGIKVVFELYAPSDIYSRKIIAAAQARVLPDIYGILDEKINFASFIKSGVVANLTEEFQKDDYQWEESLFDKALNVNRFKEDNVYDVTPGIYGVPIDVTNIQMLYNRKLLKQAGISKPPEEFEEFLKMTDALNRIGIKGLVSGWGEVWMIDCFASNYAFNIMGQDKVMATYRGEIPYTDPDWIKVFDIFQRLRERDALIEGIAAKGNKYAEQDFALQRAAFAFNGSWCVNVYQKMNKDLDYGVMLPPKVNVNQPMAIWGGAGSSFMINNNSPRKEKAIAFLRWLTDVEQQAFLARETKNLPANRTALKSIPRVLSEFAEGMEHTTHPSIWKYHEDSLVSEAFAKGIQSIIIGDQTPQEVAREVQRIKKRQVEKTRRKRP